MSTSPSDHAHARWVFVSKHSGPELSECENHHSRRGTRQLAAQLAPHPCSIPRRRSFLLSAITLSFIPTAVYWLGNGLKPIASVPTGATHSSVCCRKPDLYTRTRRLAGCIPLDAVQVRTCDSVAAVCSVAASERCLGGDSLHLFECANLRSAAQSLSWSGGCTDVLPHCAVLCCAHGLYPRCHT